MSKFYTGKMARLIRELNKPFTCPLKVVEFNKFIALVAQGNREYSDKEVLDFNKYLVDMQSIIVAEGAPCRVYGLRGFKA